MIQTKLYSDNVWKQRLWHESEPKIGVEQTKGNGRSYPYLYPIGDLIQEVFIKASMCALTKKVSWEAF
jgi:hypothetical protein